LVFCLDAPQHGWDAQQFECAQHDNCSAMPQFKTSVYSNARDPRSTQHTDEFWRFAILQPSSEPMKIPERVKYSPGSIQYLQDGAYWCGVLKSAHSGRVVSGRRTSINASGLEIIFLTISMFQLIQVGDGMSVRSQGDQGCMNCHDEERSGRAEDRVRIYRPAPRTDIQRTSLIRCQRVLRDHHTKHGESPWLPSSSPLRGHGGRPAIFGRGPRSKALLNIVDVTQGSAIAAREPEPQGVQEE